MSVVKEKSCTSALALCKNQPASQLHLTHPLLHKFLKRLISHIFEHIVPAQVNRNHVKVLLSIQHAWA